MDEPLQVVIASAMQILVAGGLLILFVFVLGWLERNTFRKLVEAFGLRAVTYSTGWLGVVAHELGHILACLIFFHKISAICLFKPDLESDVMGYVRASWNPRNPWQRIGCFFVGIAPLFTGSALLIGSSYLLIPGFPAFLRGLLEYVLSGNGNGYMEQVDPLSYAAMGTIKTILSPSNFARWEFWVFLYFSICISGHIAPSSADLRNARKGIIIIVLLVLGANFAAVASGMDVFSYSLESAKYLGVVVAFLSIATLLSLLNFSVSYLLSLVWNHAR
ncbi:MAG: hypothetical protein AAEI08_02165 [Gammaproteobacteria bacterium]